MKPHLPFCFFIFFCLALLSSPAKANPLTLADICEPFKEELIENNRRITTLRSKPDISEELRHVSWNFEHKSPIGHPIDRKQIVTWRTTRGVAVNDVFQVENMYYTLWPIDLAHELWRRGIESSKTPKEQNQSIFEVAKKAFVTETNKILTIYGQHMGYPVEKPDDLDQFMTSKRLKKNESIIFGGKKFTTDDKLTVCHLTPKSNSPSDKAFLMLMHIEAIRNVKNRFTSIGIFRCEFISERGVPLSKKTIGISKPIDTRYKTSGETASYKLRNLGLKVYPNNHIGHYIQTLYVPDEHKSQVCLANSYGNYKNPARSGDLVLTIDKLPARTPADLDKIFSRPIEQLGKKIRLDILSKYNERGQGCKTYRTLRSIEVTPDHSEMERQRKLIAEHARIKENAKQEVITKHERERLLNQMKVIEAEKKKNLELLKTREGLMQLVRKHAQPTITNFIKELSNEDPFWALSYLKYLSAVQPDVLSPKQREKLENLGWLAQNTQLYSWSFINTDNPESIKRLKALGVPLTRWNTSQTQLTVLSGEMVFLNGIFFLPIDHPKVLLDYILDDKRDSMGQLGPFAISNCGLCSVGYNIQHLMHDPKLKHLKVSFSKPTLADYQTIITSESRNYGSFDPPKPKKRTLLEIAAKGWVVTTVAANALIAGAEAAGIDTNEVLNQAKQASRQPKPSGQANTSITKLVDERTVKSTWTGKKKGVRHEYKLSNGTRITLIQVDKDNGSLTWGGAGWHLDYFSAQKLKLSSQKKFKTREGLIRYIESEGW